MVIGEKTSGRKSFINSFFRNAENIIDGSISSGFSKGLRYFFNIVFKN